MGQSALLSGTTCLGETLAHSICTKLLERQKHSSGHCQVVKEINGLMDKCQLEKEYLHIKYASNVLFSVIAYYCLCILLLYVITRNTCLAEPREARERVHCGSKLWWHLNLCMRLFAVLLRLL